MKRTSTSGLLGTATLAAWGRPIPNVLSSHIARQRLRLARFNGPLSHQQERNAHRTIAEADEFVARHRGIRR
jgi:hypothetical protein